MDFVPLLHLTMVFSISGSYNPQDQRTHQNRGRFSHGESLLRPHPRWLKPSRPEIDGLTGLESNPLNLSDPSSPVLHVSDQAFFVDADPGHSVQAIREQIFGSSNTTSTKPLMNGFAQQAEPMNVITKLSRRHHERLQAGAPPRLHFPSRKLLSLRQMVRLRPGVDAAQPILSPLRHVTRRDQQHQKRPHPRLPSEDHLRLNTENALTFSIYYQNIPASLFFKTLRKVRHVSSFHSYTLKFKLHAKLGRLPNYAVIEQRYFDVKEMPANDDHLSHDVARGQRLVKEVYETLRRSPQWNETALIITYDEHGGFYDHVATPNEGVPSPGGITGQTVLLSV